MNNKTLLFLVDEAFSPEGIMLEYIKTDNPDMFLEKKSHNEKNPYKKEVDKSNLIVELNAIIKKEAGDCDILFVNKNGGIYNGIVADLKSILYRNDHHVLISPKMNLDLFDGGFKGSDNVLGDVEAAYAHKYLTEFSIVPYPNPNFVLIKGVIWDNLGGFNEDFIDLYSALCDLAMSWNKYGYSSLIASHCFFNIEKPIKDSLDLNKVNFSHPEIKMSIKNYREMSREPMDYFSDNLSNASIKKKIVFYFLPIQPVYNGTAEYGFALINSFCSIYGENYDVSILISNSSYEFFKNDIPSNANVILEEKILKAGKFDIVFCPVQLFDVKHLPNIFSLAPRNIGVILDVIALRSMYICGFGAPKDLNALFIELCDGILSISKTSLADIKDYFNSSFSGNQLNSFTHLASDFSFSCNNKNESEEEKMPSFIDKKYILIFGNSFKHKSTREAVSALREVDVLKVVIGDRSFGYNVKKSEKFIFLPSGSIPETVIQEIYKNAHLLVFPSQYEGFGLPIFKAIQYCKKIFVYDSSINHELNEYFVENKDQVIFFKKFSELSKLVKNNLGEYAMSETKLPSWDDVARDTKNFIDEVLQKPINPQVIRLRWYISKLWQNKELGDHEISIKMLKNLSRRYFMRKFTRYFANFIKFFTS